MKKMPWKMGSMMLLAALFLANPAAASRTAECQKRCTKETKVCEDVCKKYAGSGVAKCTQACRDEEKTCSEECKNAKK